MENKISYEPIYNEYYREYTQLVIMAIERGWSKKDRKKLKLEGVYVEEQHIIPETFFIKSKRNKNKDGWLERDPNDSNNLIILTTKEHYHAHWLLMHFYNGLPKYKMIHAFWGMNKWKSKNNMDRYYDPEQYEAAKILYVEMMSLKSKGKTYEERYGVEKATELREMRRIEMTNRERKPETIEKHRLSITGRKASEETLIKLSGTWEIIDPDNNIYIIINLKRFCRENNLCQGNMSNVSLGKQKDHKGWRCSRLL